MCYLAAHCVTPDLAALMAVALTGIALATSRGASEHRIPHRVHEVIVRQGHANVGTRSGCALRQGIPEQAVVWPWGHRVLYAVRVGGRLARAVQYNGARVSTLDLPTRDTLTVLAGSQRGSELARRADSSRLTVIRVDLTACGEPLCSLAAGQALLHRSHIAAVLDPSSSGYADALGAALDQLGLDGHPRRAMNTHLDEIVLLTHEVGSDASLVGAPFSARNHAQSVSEPRWCRGSPTGSHRAFRHRDERQDPRVVAGLFQDGVGRLAVAALDTHNRLVAMGLAAV